MMSENLTVTRFNELRLPDEIGTISLNDLMNHPDTEVMKKGNTLLLRRRLAQGVTTVEFSSYSTERQEMKFSSVPHREYKKDYKEDIIAMKKIGMRQKDIAFELGISESYVSSILRHS